MGKKIIGILSIIWILVLIPSLVLGASFEREFTEIKKGEVRTMILEDSSVYEVKLVFNKYLDSANLEVQTFTEHPRGIKNPELKDKIYKYINFKESRFSSQDLSSFDFKFRISKEWFDMYKIDKSTIKVYKYNKGIWSIDPYTFEGEDGNSYYYKVSSSPLLFLVTGEENSIVPEKIEKRESVVVGSAVGDGKEKSESKSYTWLLTILIIGAIVCLVFIFSGKKDNGGKEGEKEYKNPIVSEMQRSGLNVSEEELKKNQDQLRRELRL